MAHKRALIVDDSRSARLFLARILEKHDIEVDSVESAEAAIGYLASRRPDVIFMDHMMPGMDGFQAVQAIKNDPRTATIPILMYTSQEGEVYLGQARALGAVGVLPKQIKHADVSKVLYQLHLIADRRSEEQTTFKPLETVMPHIGREGARRETAAPPRPPHGHGGVSGTMLGSELEEPDSLPALRRWLLARLESQTDRITAEIQAVLPPRGGAPGSGWVAGVAIVACIAAVIAVGAWWSDHTRLQAARAQLLQLRQAMVERSTAAPVAVPPPPAASVAASGASSQATLKPLVLQVPYGADDLGGPRLTVIRQMLDRLVADHVSAVVQIHTFAGRFCLKGDPVNGYALASDKTPFAQCDVVGNPSDDALPPAQRMPLALANLIAGIRDSTHGALDVETAVGDPAMLKKQYPTVTDELTAGEWNRVGKANNRVEILVR
ncbi:MAG TPA: response regulator [Steroidobacteraceae bacterium]|jgi:CheY-like chemotaxis protein|nr:response regulator [Steroidobacteraceae bacterium]